MALTKISRGLLDTGVSDSSDSTAITIDSSENVGIGRTPNANGILQLNVASGSNCNITFSENTTEKFLMGSVTSSNAFRIYDLANSAERIRIDSSGNVGIGTTSPSQKLSVTSGDNTSSTNIARFAANNDSLAIGIGYESIRQTETGGAIKFETNGSERMTVTDAGNVGIGISAPTSKLYVDGGTFSGYVTNFYNAGSGGSNHGMYMETQSTSSYLGLWRTGGTTRFYVDGSGNYYFSGSNQSDRNKKENITDLTDNALDLVTQLQPKKYNYIGSDIDKAGFIAQDMETVIPRLVSGNAFDADASDDIATNPTGKGIDYMGYTAYLTKAIQELKTELDAAKARIETLENA